MEGIRMSRFFPVSPQVLYQAWLDSNEHGRFTGSEAEVEPGAGGRFSAWEGYISGTTTVLEPYVKIVQLWRTTDFEDHDPDSTLELTFEAVDGGTQFSLYHYGFPPGQINAYKEGWESYYLEPMSAYFGGI